MKQLTPEQKAEIAERIRIRRSHSIRELMREYGCSKSVIDAISRACKKQEVETQKACDESISDAELKPA